MIRWYEEARDHRIYSRYWQQRKAPRGAQERDGRTGTKSWQRSRVSIQREKTVHLEGKSSDTAAKEI